MAFPFPTNPRNGQKVNYTNSKGLLMVATYNSVKNEWEVETALPPSSIVTGTPEINVSPSADGQVIAWDDTTKTWVAKTLAYKTQDLTDVATAIVPTDGQVLKYVAARNQYEPTLIGSDVWQATADQVAARPGATDADKVAAVYALLNPGGTASEGNVILVSAGDPVNGGYVGSWYYTGTEWVLGASGGAAGTVTPTINYRPDSTTPQVPGSLTGDLDVVTETNNHQLNVYDGTLYQAVFRESIIKQWIAAGSLFQGAVDAKAELLNLPAPDIGNKGFYWTWTGPGATDVAPADFPGGLGFTATLQVGDWIQSDGTKYIHVPSDLLSKLRWEGVGSFQAWSDTNWEKDSLVRYQGKFYRSKQAVATGAVAPDQAGSLWDDITPTYTLDDLTNVDVAGANATNKVLVYDELNAKWKAASVNLDDLANVNAAARTDATALDTGDLIFYDKTTTSWKVKPLAALAKDYIHIGDLNDFNVVNVQDGDYLVYDGTRAEWRNTPTVRARVDFLSDVGDVEINAIPESGDALAWAGTKWVPTKVGGMGEWKAANSYPQNSLVLHRNSIWLATAAIQSGIEPGATIAPTTITVGIQRSVATLASNSQPGSTNIETLSEVPQAWNVGDYWLIDTTGLTFPVTINGGILNGVVITGPGRVFVVDKDGSNGWLGYRGAHYVPNSAGVTTSFTITPGGLTSNPWRKELDISVAALSDVDKTATPTNGQTLVYQTSDSKWHYGASANTLSDLTDTVITAPVAGQTLSWNGTKWVNTAGGDSSAQRGVGEIIPWMADVLPDDYLPCDGRVVAKATYAELHAVIGNKYNAGTAADGTSTFALPDLRGYFLRGIGAHGGESNIGIVQEDTTRLPRTNFVGTAASNGGHYHYSGVPVWDNEGCFYGYRDGMTPSKKLGNYDGNAGRVSQTSNDGAHTHSVTLTGGDPETRPKSISVRWVIRYRPINGGAAGPKGDSGNDSVLLGTISQSILTESQFKVQLGAADADKWVLADGRDVTNSRYHTVTGNTRVPDLRGAFLRMAGQNATNTAWIGGALGSFVEDTTRRPRSTAFTTDSQGNHNHTVTIPLRRADVSSGWSGSGDLLVRKESTAGTSYSQTETTSSNGAHTHTITGGGDAETVPKHYSVNYYIKIN